MEEYNAWPVEAVGAAAAHGDREAERRHEWLRRPAAPLGCGAHLRLLRTMAPCKRCAVPLPRAGGRCRFGQGTFAGASGNDDDAPTDETAAAVICGDRRVSGVAGSRHPVLRLRGLEPHPRQEPPMTDKAISPLRRRLIEDMTIRRLSPKTQLHYIRHVKRFADFLGRSADKATTEDVHRYQLWLASIGTTVADRQRQCHCPAVLLQGHAEAPRSCRGGRLDPRASPPARCSEPGRGRSAARLGEKHQAQGALEPGLRHRPASLGGRIAQAHRHRS